MNKLKIATTLLAVCACSCAIAALSGCGDDNTTPPHEHSYSSVTTEYTFLKQCSCGEVKKDGYRVQIVYEADGSEADEGITVVWKSKTTGSEVFSETDEFGYAEKLNLTEDEYEIYLYDNTMPSINGVVCTYDKSGFSTQQNGVGLTIPIFAENKPSNANDPTVTGRLSTTEDRFDIQLNKKYVAQINSAEDFVWYTVQNEGVGKYTVAVDSVADNTVSLNRYAANIAYVAEQPDPNQDTSVQNKLTYTVVESDKLQDSTFKMQVLDAPSYPVYVPFTVSITYVPEYTPASTQYVAPSRFTTEADTYTYQVEERGGQTVYDVTVDCLSPTVDVEACADVTDKTVTALTADLLDELTLDEDGFYRLANGTLVYAKINATSIFETYTLLTYIESGNRTIYIVSEYDAEYEYATKREDYFGFVTAYAGLCNGDGVYGLTEELKDYLTIVARKEHRGLEELLCFYA